MLHVPSMEGLGLAAFAVTPGEIAQRKTFVFMSSVCTTASQTYEACDARVGTAAVVNRDARSGEENANLFGATQCVLKIVRSWASDGATTLRERQCVLREPNGRFADREDGQPA